MLSGKQFRLTKTTVGIHLVNGTARVVSIPLDGVIKVLSGPNANGKLYDKGLIYALWEEQTVALFAVDVEARGAEIQQIDSAHKSPQRRRPHH